MKEKILVLVRTTPEKSKKYGSTVCVAGINENNEWRRLYPFRFSYGQQLIDFKKRDIIEVDLAMPDNDKRKESRKVKNHKTLNQSLHGTDLINRISPIVTSIENLTKENATLGVVKPIIESIKVRVNDMKLYDDQTYLTLTEGFLERREKVKLPVELSYLFKCENEPLCRGHDIQVIDWELNELTRNLLRRYADKKVVEQKIKKKFYDFMLTRELYFVMGTHFKYSTWIIIGLLYPQKEAIQNKLLREYI